jgi:hypothetical protein
VQKITLSDPVKYARRLQTVASFGGQESDQKTSCGNSEAVAIELIA